MRTSRTHRTERTQTAAPTLVAAIRKNTELTAYHKKQIIHAIKKGLEPQLKKDWEQFTHHAISGETLVKKANNYLVDREIKDNTIFFTSMEDFFDRY